MGVALGEEDLHRLGVAAEDAREVLGGAPREVEAADREPGRLGGVLQLAPFVAGRLDRVVAGQLERVVALHQHAIGDEHRQAAPQPLLVARHDVEHRHELVDRVALAGPGERAQPGQVAGDGRGDQLVQPGDQGRPLRPVHRRRALGGGGHAGGERAVPPGLGQLARADLLLEEVAVSLLLASHDVADQPLGAAGLADGADHGGLDARVALERGLDLAELDAVSPGP